MGGVEEVEGTATGDHRLRRQGTLFEDMLFEMRLGFLKMWIEGKTRQWPQGRYPFSPLGWKESGCFGNKVSEG